VKKRIIVSLMMVGIIVGIALSNAPHHVPQHKVMVALIKPPFKPAKPLPPTIDHPKTVAVIDTGIADAVLKEGYEAGICKFGHKDFTGEGLTDKDGHGTNVSGLINRGAHGSNYCQVIIKFYDPYNNIRNMKHWLAAIRYAIDLKVDYINLSGGGKSPLPGEKDLIEEALNKGIKVVVAAGNENADLEEQPYYPAFYDPRIIVVGNGRDELHRSLMSNYGTRVTVWRKGDNQTAHGITQTGTSQATAIYTGELIKADFLKSQEKSDVQRK
jgi:subtilisin family serine protease